jgi:quercetin dioxygenase-like cupin family protein
MFRHYEARTDRELAPGIEITYLCHGEKTLMARFHLAAGAALPLHSHPHEQTGYLISGHLTFDIDGDVFDARPGDSWCIPGDMVHGVDVLDDTIIIEVFAPRRDAYLPPDAAT